ncbi:MAG: hypothetical protein ACT4PN_06245 [Nitrospiraceae bacterium]
MANRKNSKRVCIMIVDHDWEYGIKIADWLAAHGYQAVLVRSLQSAATEFLDSRPDAVLVGLAQTGSAFPIDLQRLFRAIETACAHVPVITMGSRTSELLTNILYGRALRHRHLPIKPVEFTYISRLLRSELDAATASPHSPSTEPRPSAGRAVENRMYERTVYREVKAWSR